ncbi:MAG: hypothetical protein O6650_08535 [Actinobacteria bacterium]|nr:hypothetical protein [Actinomycetota bacterium]
MPLPPARTPHSRPGGPGQLLLHRHDLLRSLPFDVEPGPVVDLVAEPAGGHDVAVVVAVGVAFGQQMVPAQVEPLAEGCGAVEAAVMQRNPSRWRTGWPYPPNASLNATLRVHTHADPADGLLVEEA